ncbi:protein disulfide isomerase FrnE [Winogradskya consettensis]|uniref:DSBA oxidoreductase n=1 Tax=Winogradskya consettensis TaxID=113560 RepID=A0A919SI23_9ACTN|nr:DsbA family oxidoreductase [Actinoplanes consettensis]GIM72305.1 DSBA oxidoreductase [Actinoplanes consettensis]
MNIEVWSDLVCPWCYLGKHRLESVLHEFPSDVTLTFRAFQLDPSPVPQPIPIKQAMAEKLGNPERADQMFTGVTAIAAAEGLTINFDRAILANTFDAHRLVAWAATQDLQLMMIDTLQQAHFEHGIDLGSHHELARLAGAIGLDEEAALAYLESPAGTDAVNADLAEARELDITSVPNLVVDRKFAIQGAQESSVLRSALEEIARRGFAPL